jgi:hypothetical protein
MSKLITAKIDVTKIPKEAIYIGEKGKYLSIDIWINDEDDNYGNDTSINVSQSKEDREAKVKKVYIGNGKTKFGFSKSEPQQSEPRRTAAGGVAVDKDDDMDSIPF